jgi:hypothetical protein
MKLRICTTVKVGKKMSTQRDKVNEGDEVVNCTMTIKGMRVSRDDMEELSGVPIGSMVGLFNQLGEPFEHMSFLLPKRALYCIGSIEHKRESGATLAKLEFTRAIASNIRFNLFSPDDRGPTALMSFSMLWIAAGDEVDDVRDILTHQCLATLIFEEADKQIKLFGDSKPDPVGERKAGQRAKLDKQLKRANDLAKEGIELIDKIEAAEAPKPVEPDPKPAGGAADKPIGPKFESEIRAAAARRPRSERPPAKR